MLSHHLNGSSRPEQLKPAVILKSNFHSNLLSNSVSELILAQSIQRFEARSLTHLIQVGMRVARSCLVHSFGQHKQYIRIPVYRPIFICTAIFRKRPMIIFFYKGNFAVKCFGLFEGGVRRIAEHFNGGFFSQISLLIGSYNTWGGDI